MGWVGDPTICFRIGTGQPNSTAATVGLQPGDVVASLDGRYRGAFESTSLLADLRSSAGRTVHLGIEHGDGSFSEVSVTLRSTAQIDADHGALGIERPAATTTRGAIHYALGDALAVGAQRTVDALGLIVNGLGQLGDSIVNRPTEPPPVAGPLGTATQIGDIFWQL